MKSTGYNFNRYQLTRKAFEASLFQYLSNYKFESELDKELTLDRMFIPIIPFASMYDLKNKDSSIRKRIADTSTTLLLGVILASSTFIIFKSLALYFPDDLLLYCGIAFLMAILFVQFVYSPENEEYRWIVSGIGFLNMIAFIFVTWESWFL